MDQLLAPGGIGVAALALAALYAGLRHWYYFAGTCPTSERDEWKAIALASVDTIQKQADQITKLTEVNETFANALRPAGGRR